MKKVLTVGVYDYFHYGHLRLFQRAKQYGDYLMVAVQDGEYILKYKPEAEICYSTEQRVEMISALRVVDEVLVYKDVDEFVKTVDFDILILGGDQLHSGFVRAKTWSEENGKKVIRLSRTEGISSSQIKRELQK